MRKLFLDFTFLQVRLVFLSFIFFFPLFCLTLLFVFFKGPKQETKEATPFVDIDWTKRENVEKFFLDFAQEKGFDPLRPEGWLWVSKKDIKKTEKVK